MAGKLRALLVVAFFFTVALPAGVRVYGQAPTCQPAELCRDDFLEDAQTADQSEMCGLLRVEVDCYHQVRDDCTTEQKPYVDSLIQNAENYREANGCGAGWIRASHWLMAVSAILAVIYHRRF